MANDMIKPIETKLTDWANEPSIGDLQQNLDDAKSDYNKHINDVDIWLDNLNITGRAVIKKRLNRSSVVPKVIRKQAEWRYGSLSEPFLSTPDVFNVEPVTAGDRKRAQQNALVLNNQFNTKLDKVDFIDAYVRDAVDLGTVIVKVGWDSEETEVEEEVPIFEFIPVEDPEMLQKSVQAYTQLLQLKLDNRDIYEQNSNPGLDQALQIFAETGQVTTHNQIDTVIKKVKKETKNQPIVEVCDHKNIVMDPSCSGDIRKASFIGETFKGSVASLTKDGKYKNLDGINKEAASPLTDPDYEETPDNDSFNFTDEPRKQFVVQQYWGNWDIHGDGIVVPIVAAWVGNRKIRMAENPFPDKEHPFVKAVYLPVRKSLYGQPDGELLIDNQNIIGATTRGMIDLMGRSANSQIGMQQNFLDTTNQRKYKRGEDYVFNQVMNPQQAVYEHTYPEIPSSAYNMISMQNTDAESLTGVKAFATAGISGKSLGDSVGGGRDALDAASKREFGILRRLSQGVIQIGRKLISMNAEFLSEEEIIRITNEEFVSVRRDDLAGNFDLELNISTAEADNKKAEELAFMLQTTGNNMDPDLRNMILSDIARLRKMPGMAKKIEEYQPKPDPFVEMEKELQLHLLKAQIAKEETLAIKHAATAELDGVKGLREETQAKLNEAKVSTERAKARDLGSGADKKDLDFIEQESGVNQARNLELDDNKAKNDLTTKVVSDKLKPEKKTA
jgi:hypothetical protein